MTVILIPINDKVVNMLLIINLLITYAILPFLYNDNYYTGHNVINIYMTLVYLIKCLTV